MNWQLFSAIFTIASGVTIGVLMTIALVTGFDQIPHIIAHSDCWLNPIYSNCMDCRQKNANTEYCQNPSNPSCAITKYAR